MGWWQHIPEHINPVIFGIGPLKLRWYGLMYLVAFFVVWRLSVWRINKGEISIKKDELEQLILWEFLGVVIGGRLGYALFYDLPFFIKHPLSIFLPTLTNKGLGLAGMSYHGGVIGAIAALVIFTRKRRINIWHLADGIIPAVPLGFTFGRIGNFINGELYGRETSSPIGMYFPADPYGLLRHPSQLYEAFFEGIVLFAILWSIRNKDKFPGFLLAIYFIGYGAFRFFIEFFRQPDPQLGFVLFGLTMGQLLCSAMILTGVIVILIQRRAKVSFTSSEE
ncbi:prolipoprotein diacylglyceryl transferase [bacterium]|nr:prolipoprotein diacylglyceryl transferase [bacterium]